MYSTPRTWREMEELRIAPIGEGRRRARARELLKPLNRAATSVCLGGRASRVSSPPSLNPTFGLANCPFRQFALRPGVKTTRQASLSETLLLLGANCPP